MWVSRVLQSGMASGFLVRSTDDDPNQKPGYTRVVASTAVSDRYGDVVDQKSWNLDAYKNNPVILHNHWGDVIGRAVSIEVVSDQLVAEIEWDTDPSNPVGVRVASQFARGFMRAVSVGFRSRAITRRDDLPEDHPAYSKSGGLFLSNNELYEISAVGIPANPEALTFGADPDLLRSAVEAEIRRFVDLRRLEKPRKADDLFDFLGI